MHDVIHYCMQQSALIYYTWVTDLTIHLHLCFNPEQLNALHSVSAIKHMTLALLAKLYH